jgi:hypothetical protein
MALDFVVLLGVAFLASAAYLLIQRGRRNIILERLHIARRRVSGARTPPRSLSPGKNTIISNTEPDYADTFPPSRRFTLGDNGLVSKSNKQSEKLKEPEEEWKRNLIPMNMSYLDADESCFVPCGFSIKEVKALGHFPDYATLSGVPLPNPYLDFDIKKAQPRPYRPFRWAYHQTMCECLEQSVPRKVLTMNSNHKAADRLVAGA